MKAPSTGPITTGLRSEADRVFREAYTEGRRESAGAYLTDALVRLVTGQGGEDGKPRSRESRSIMVASITAVLRQVQAGPAK